jgi:hypothetical protein
LALGKPLDRANRNILENDMRARIYRPARNAMQSGKARTKQWLLEYEPETPRTIDPLMGWTSSKDMRQQLSLEFDTSEEAVAYAKAHGIPYQLFEPHLPTPKPKAYSDNFRFDRRVPWSH